MERRQFSQCSWDLVEEEGEQISDPSTEKWNGFPDFKNGHLSVKRRRLKWRTRDGNADCLQPLLCNDLMNLPALLESIHCKWQLGWAVKISLGLLSRIHCGTCISLIAYEVWHITKSSLTSERITITVLSISIPAGVFDQSDWWKDYKRPSYLDRRLEVSSSTSIRPPSLSPERVVFQRTLSSS